MVFKRNQIVILSLILVILVAGYLQYSYKKGSSSASKDTGRLGEAVYVDNQKVSDSDSAIGSKVDESLDVKKDAELSKTADVSKTTDASKVADNEQKAVSASKTAADFFAQAKLDKDLSRSKSADSLKAIADDESASKETRAAASEQRIKLIQNAEKEMRIETLIKEKNFDDAVVLFADDGSLDIVVKTPELSASQTTQIADIASRQAKVDIAVIHVRSFY